MKISLIENGLDSLKKGYNFLGAYERYLADGADDAQRFSALKDSVLSIQHGIEILFKYALKEHNELLLFTDLSKLKQAFKSRRNGEIVELYEAEGVHTVTFKESIERLIDICGLPITEKFKKKLLKVEGWRNNITHSGVLLLENEVSSVLINLLEELDNFFGPIIGAPYLEGQGRTELNRAYRLTKAVYGELENKVKALIVERLIHALQVHDVKNITAPDVFYIDNADTAFSILRKIQGENINYGCDLINGHCSGNAKVINLSDSKIITISTVDNNANYQFSLDSIVVYIPEIQSDISPLIFMYAKSIEPSDRAYIRGADDYTVQHGIVFNEDGIERWEKSYYEQSIEDYDSDYPKLPAHKELIRFLSDGPICFLNVQKLEYGNANRLMNRRAFPSGRSFFEAFKADLEAK
ncbi:hypothetical protein OU997_13830 [Pseudomonas sp. SL4(2022)]|uniref:hypothetical protein n=1 Tax=Pseudomonas sp. SL4(2022) TaxID=2994661 RepID=UPI00226F3062|nr:hypothetical protein [Pseudomonas sp. SL4(2022)]WAC43355.1 hypothetical protein OU997_13830 [Pseudomonas sp. SL4(2022)]